MNRTEKKYTSKIKVGHGTFYTYQHTYATFECVGSKCNRKELGHVAKVMAADIHLSSGESVSFKIKNRKLPLPYADGVTYDIYFFNHCEGEHCTGDFHMVFDAVEVDTNDRFSLKRVGSGKDIEPPGLCLRLNTEKIFLNDEAPCMGGGFGGGGGFP